MSTIGATAFTLPTYDESALKEIAGFQARAAKLLNFLQQKAEREPEWAAHHDNGKWGHCEQIKDLPPDENICATPVCALGWAVDQGMCEDVTMHVTARWDERGFFGIDWDESQKRMLKTQTHSGLVPYRVSLNGLSTCKIKAEYRRRAASRYSISRDDWDVEPVVDGRTLTWSNVGLKYFGSVVAMSVFFDGAATLSQVIERLQEYVDHARITMDFNHDDEVSYELMCKEGNTVYFHHPDTLRRVGQVFLDNEHGRLLDEIDAHDDSLFRREDTP